MKQDIKEIELLKGRDVVNHLAVALKINEMIKNYNIMLKTLKESAKK